jgi:hypothetical protein
MLTSADRHRTSVVLDEGNLSVVIRIYTLMKISLANRLITVLSTPLHPTTVVRW